MTAETRAAQDALSSVEEFLAEQDALDVLRFITCGSVDDGKSTLIGRLLWDAQEIFDDQISTLERDSEKHGTQGDEIDFALLVDGLAAEREQGITIDVAYRFFSTDRRKFIVADTPGHEQYTRNMITGASTADAAVILIDARQGVLTQTRRHAYLASLSGIKHIVLAVNKMDLVEFDADVFNRIVDDFSAFAQDLTFESVTAIPVSALRGDNITSRSGETTWYSGPTLLACLETLPKPVAVDGNFVFPVQWVSRPHSGFRGFSGTVVQGAVAVGDEVRVTASGQTARVKSIVSSFNDTGDHASADEAVTLTLDKEIDASRGDILSGMRSPVETSDQFEATIVWMAEEDGLAGRTFDLKLAGQWATGTISRIKHLVNVNTMEHEPGRTLALNDISVCTVSLSRPLALDSYQSCRALGSFILVDRMTHGTVAAGMIHHSLRRATNIHKHAMVVTRQDREKLNGHAGKVIWFTGLSGSGKSTIASALEGQLHQEGLRTYILDGDNVRLGLNKDLGFTDADRVENIRRIAEVARLMLDSGMIVMTAFISPFIAERQMARELVGEDNFVEIFVDTPLEVCEERDVKGLYKKARAGEIPNLTGIGSPYEAPKDPEMTVDTSTGSLDDIVAQIRRQLG